MTPESPINQEETYERPRTRFPADGAAALRNMNAILARAEGRDFSAMDTGEIVRTLVPADGENYRALTHIHTAARFGRALAERLGMNVEDIESAAWLHDAGRFANVHRYFRNDRVGDLLLRKLDLRARVENLLQPDRTFTHPAEFPSSDVFSDEQKAVILADIAGRMNDEGRFVDFEDTMVRHRNSRAPAVIDTPWPSERAGLTPLTDEVIVQWEDIYRQVRAWAAGKGADIDEIKREFEAADAAAPIDTVIFDIGGVLIKDSDPVIIADFLRSLDITEEQLNAAWADIVTGLQTGALSEDAFWSKFEINLGKSVPAEHRNLFQRGLDVAVDPRMTELIRRIKASGKRLLALSDTIPQHVDKLTAAGVFDAFDRALVSPEIRCSKKAGSAHQRDSRLAAYCVAALHTKSPRQGCIFIDDKEKYVVAAKEAGMKALQFTSIERLEADLEAAGVI